MKLQEEQCFMIHNDLNLGRMQCYFAGDSIVYEWVPTRLAYNQPMGWLKEIQDVTNKLKAEKFNTFNKVVTMCKGEERKDYFTKSLHYNYWIRLVPVKNDYCIYIRVYTNK